MTEQERAKIELAEYRDAAYERLHALCGTRADAPNWADIACLLRERQELKHHAQCAPLREALERSVVAIDDWLHIYASEHCSDDRVEEAKARVYEHGTLWYIASVQDQNRTALSSTDG